MHVRNNLIAFIAVLFLSFQSGVGGISKVEIGFYPSFHSSSVVELNKNRNTGTFKVTGTKEQLIFKLSDNELFQNFFSEEFIRSLPKNKEEKEVVTDGVIVNITYKQNSKKIKVQLGNDRTKKADSILLKQVKVLDSICTDQVMKDYIRELIEYFPRN